MVTSLICNKNSHLLLFIALPAAVNSFLTTSGVLSTLNLITANRQPFKIPCSASYRADANNDTDIEEDEIEIKPYRNRSLAWTLRYRRLNPYERARARVISFGHRSKEDWDEAVSSGQLGQYVPNYPDEMYAPEWDSWDEWLGLMRSYNETKEIATKVLKLNSLDDYLNFVRCNTKRAEGLRIPARPDVY
ncbi:hypothetical protein ACHAXN_011558 [Cyclotella atomus]